MCSAPWDHPLHGPTRCGQCMECRLAYSREWAIRMSHEKLMHAKSSFVTLTFNDACLPRYGQLLKRPLQLFFMRLRKAYGPFRYVACGEYGEMRRRPHYHVALFGIDFQDDRIPTGRGVQGDPLFVSPRLTAIWKNGDLLQQTIGELTFESAAYIGRYLTKRVSGVGASPLPLAVDPETGECVMPNPEFLLVSKGRKRGDGIGGSWFRKFGAVDVLPHGRVITSQGTPAPVPRYYKELIKVPHMPHAKLQADLEALTLPRMYENLDARRREDSPERRAARSIYAASRTGVFKRDLKG